MTDLKTTRLDFDGIKDNLRLFLESQAELQDYNFSGSTMNVILDVMAATTHYNGLYAQQASNEAFLDTAILRSSVVSRAKELGYIPRQFSPSRTDATISITVPGTDTSTEFVIPKYTKFTGELDGKSIPFLNIEQYTLTNRVGNVYTGSIQLWQGEVVNDSFIFDQSATNKFILTAEQIYTDLLNVEVLPFEGASTKTQFTEAGSIVELTSTSNVFFWEENVNGDVEIYFGDGVIGSALTSGNEVQVEMFSTLGSEGNGANSFAISQSVNGILSSDIVVSNTQPSLYGTNRESTESIRNLAPKLYTVQDRLVTVDDYRAYTLKTFGNIESLSVWPGDENIPAFFGRVFLSIKPIGSDALSQFEKDNITNDLDSKTVVGITTEIVDPDLVSVNISSTVRYDNTIATVSQDQIGEIVEDSIATYFSETLNSFSSELIYSRLLAAIDSSNPAITGNITTLTLDKAFIPNDGPSSYVFDFSNAIEPNSLISNTWTDGLNNFYIVEEEGVINLYRDANLFRTNIGTVNYADGEVELVSFDPSINVNDSIVLTITPQSFDIKTERNNILVSKNITVTVT